MDFPSNTFAVQGQDAYMLYLEQKIHGKNFCTLLKTAKTTKVYPSVAFPIYGISPTKTIKKQVLFIYKQFAQVYHFFVTIKG